MVRLLSYFKEYQWESIPKNNNRLMNAMAGIASLIPLEVKGKETTLTIKKLETPSIFGEDLKIVCVT